MYTRIALILTMLTAFTWHLQAQHRPYLTIGAGWPEAFTIGMKVPTGSCTIGLAVGGAEGYSTFNTDLAYHFAGQVRENTLRPWYLRMPVIYTRNIPRKGIHQTSLSSGFKFGYAWFPSPKIGLCLDAGIAYFLYDDESAELYNDEKARYIAPSANLAIYVRL